MREILFRAKTIKGNWIEGDLIHKALTAHSMIVDYGIAEECCYPVEVVPETIGQYTNQVDVDGNKIFDGDIVGTDKKGHTWHVEWGYFGDGGWWVTNGINSGRPMTSDYGDELTFCTDGTEVIRCKVDGSIHDDKEK